jgi:hypothetical protein
MAEKNAVKLDGQALCGEAISVKRAVFVIFLRQVKER